MDTGLGQVQGAGARPTHLQHTLLGSSSPAANSAFPTVKGFRLMTSTQPSISDCNGFRENRDRSKDATFSIIRERNFQYVDGIRSLPRPLALAPQDDGEFVEHLSPKELLQRHVKRAKRIRSRLREERLRRIARYKTRLALLLPPMIEQQFRSDPASGN
ncbi:unnamed protein product [Withania somnifera]